MARQKKSEKALGILAAVLAAPILFANWVHDKIGVPQPITYVFLASILVPAVWVFFMQREKRFRAIRIANIDSMTGVEFESYLKRLPNSRGYMVKHHRRQRRS